LAGFPPLDGEVNESTRQARDAALARLHQTTPRHESQLTADHRQLIKEAAMMHDPQQLKDLMRRAENLRRRISSYERRRAR
jgi:hypothetical protein